MGRNKWVMNSLYKVGGGYIYGGFTRVSLLPSQH